MESEDMTDRERLFSVNAALSGHLAVAALLVINLSVGSPIGALMAPAGWALAQVHDALAQRWVGPALTALKLAIRGSQIAAAVLALIAAA